MFSPSEPFMDASFLSEQFSAALAYDAYVRTGTDEQQRRWKQVYDAATLTEAQKNLIGTFTRQMNVLIISGIWCGDCVQQCPLLEKIASANPRRIAVRFVDRDQHKDLSSQLRINGGDRVPVALFLAEDHELCGVYGERTLSRYRAIARRQLGPSCEIAIATPDTDELAAGLQDWLNEFERIQLMLRISPRLRQKHAD
jgi:thioredoxin-like negative regulator of GroEL